MHFVGRWGSDYRQALPVLPWTTEALCACSSAGTPNYY